MVKILEEKSLLFKDLCARLPYGVIVLEDIDKTFDGGCVSELVTITEIKGEKMLLTEGSLTPVSLDEIKQYLRPMSSMTEEEKIESLNFAWEDDYGRLASYNENISKYIDWLNAHHFDYRGLIEKGLALEAPKGMY